MVNGENGLSKTIADLERKAELLETENVSLKQTNALNTQVLDSHEKEIAKLKDDRDYYLTQNAQLRTLIEGAGEFLVAGMNKIKANDAREQGIQLALRQGNAANYSPTPAGLDPRWLNVPDRTLGHGAEMSEPKGSS